MSSPCPGAAAGRQEDRRVTASGRLGACGVVGRPPPGSAMGRWMRPRIPPPRFRQLALVLCLRFLVAFHDIPRAGCDRRPVAAPTERGVLAHSRSLGDLRSSSVQARRRVRGSRRAATGYGRSLGGGDGSHMPRSAAPRGPGRARNAAGLSRRVPAEIWLDDSAGGENGIGSGGAGANDAGALRAQRTGSRACSADAGVCSEALESGENLDDKYEKTAPSEMAVGAAELQNGPADIDTSPVTPSEAPATASHSRRQERPDEARALSSADIARLAGRGGTRMSCFGNDSHATGLAAHNMSAEGLLDTGSLDDLAHALASDIWHKTQARLAPGRRNKQEALACDPGPPGGEGGSSDARDSGRQENDLALDDAEWAREALVHEGGSQAFRRGRDMLR